MLLRFLSLKLKPFILSDCRFVLVRRIFRMMSVIFSQCDTSRNSSLWYPCVTYSIHFQWKRCLEKYWGVLMTCMRKYLSVFHQHNVFHAD
jgi:hypothetical protein